MISYFLGIISVYLCRYLLTPRPVVIYGETALDLLGYNEDMGHQFSTVIENVRYAWDIENLWLEVESLDAVDWEIPEHFKDDWSWGKTHPADHIERCMNADLSYPILIWDGAIVDGCHRTVKALAKGQKTIKAKVIVNIPPPDSEGEPDLLESNEDVHWTFGDMVLLIQSMIEYEEIKEYKYRHPADGI